MSTLVLKTEKWIGEKKSYSASYDYKDKQYTETTQYMNQSRFLVVLVTFEFAINVDEAFA